MSRMWKGTGSEQDAPDNCYNVNKEVSKMAFGDGTGPMGLGPMTGRGAGYCAGYSAPGYMNPVAGRGFWGGGAGAAVRPPVLPTGAPYQYHGGYPYGPVIAPGFGWGYGRGFGRGFGRGWGRGRGRGRGSGAYLW